MTFDLDFYFELTDYAGPRTPTLRRYGRSVFYTRRPLCLKPSIVYYAYP
ncbi:MAG TPA: hypothetical protein VKB96_16080 [Gammaproteobacteria bacterium]|nr:hypothetical protein [Gammaproteobacteria bacterium]